MQTNVIASDKEHLNIFLKTHPSQTFGHIIITANLYDNRIF